MNAKLVCRNVAGYAADALGVTLERDFVDIGELRLSHQAHLQFINGRTLGDLLSGSSLELETGECLSLLPPTRFELPCRLHDVPYSMLRVLVPLVTVEERKELDGSKVRA